MSVKINMDLVKELEGFDLYKGNCLECKAEFITTVNGVMTCNTCGVSFAVDVI